MPPTRPPHQSAQPAQRLPTVGEQFDKYSLLAKLATGGMAELFVARLSGAAGFSKTVVIKRILPHVAHDEHFIRMFLDEAKTCAQINHPNVCQVFELCKSHGSHFLVLEHLEGATVGDLIRRSLLSEQKLDLQFATGIIVQACDGLHSAHEQVDDEGKHINLVHRDVSPGNLFVTVDGIVKVLDFGIAKAQWMSRKTRTGTLLGKCEYMSPEQARGGVPLDRRSDIFSLGITAWELICGRRLFRRESEYETLKAVLRAPIPRPSEIRSDIPRALDDAIMHALERDSCDRYRSAYEFRQALSSALKESGGPTPMCDVAPVIRQSFAEELRLQRALLKEATKIANQRASNRPNLRSVPPASDDLAANTAEVTGKHRRLPSLIDPDLDEPESRELTFQSKPGAVSSTHRPLRIAAPAPTPASDAVASGPEADADTDLQSGFIPGPEAETTLSINETPITPLVAIPKSAARAIHDSLSDVDSAQLAVLRASRRPLILIAAMLVLCGSLAATATLLFLDSDGASGPAPLTSASPEPSADQGASVATMSEAPRPVPTPPASADENARAAQRIAASPSKAVVTSLPGTGAPVSGVADANTGTLSIDSNKPAKLYLYPDKELIGTTPLRDFALPPGTYKLKAMVGPGKSDKKYFQVRIREGESTQRSFTHWR